MKSDRRQEASSNQFSSIFSFVSDRLRSVRQDMVMQNLDGKSTVILMEKMLPFYIETDGLCKMMVVPSYNPKLHDFQLEECFGRWHDEIKSSGDITPNSLISAAFFFRQLHRKPTLLHELFIFRPKLSQDTFNLIRSICSCFYSNNYYRFFCQFKSLDSLLRYSLSDSVFTLRQSAMRIISVAFKTSVARLPSKLLADWLGFPVNIDIFNVFLHLYNVIPDDQGNILVSAIKLVEIPYENLPSRQY
ncbi:hypothetical protein CRE_21637 [Caenorhabditis remanei]|uniref:SAC3/GANP/THP3 conserved domain-containing protein n=1 Tax=Caenorhabditis remanei TaxID=31234 RepID=E3NQF9_CAERE|nr:hypothetical protein CRE_21637 [Caenorhabditis remanei]